MGFLDTYITDLNNISLNINEYMERVEKKIPGLVESSDIAETEKTMKIIQDYRDQLHEISTNIDITNSSFQSEVLKMQNDISGYVKNVSVIQHHVNNALTDALAKIDASFIPKE